MKKTMIQMESGSTVDWDVYEEMSFDLDDDTGEEIEVTTEYVKIDNLFVAEEERGQGIGRKLLEQAVRAIKAELPEYEIKIVADPKEDSVELDRLAAFYDSVSGIDEVVAI